MTGKALFGKVSLGKHYICPKVGDPIKLCQCFLWEVKKTTPATFVHFAILKLSLSGLLVNQVKSEWNSVTTKSQEIRKGNLQPFLYLNDSAAHFSIPAKDQ